MLREQDDLFWLYIKRAGCFGRSRRIAEPKTRRITTPEKKAPGAKLQARWRVPPPNTFPRRGTTAAEHPPSLRLLLFTPGLAASSLLHNMTDVRKGFVTDTMQINDVPRIVLLQRRRAFPAQGHAWKFQADMKEAHRVNFAAISDTLVRARSESEIEFTG